MKEIIKFFKEYSENNPFIFKLQICILILGILQVITFIAIAVKYLNS